LDQRDLFKEGAIALEALSETTNRDADSVVMNPAGKLPKFITLSLPRILPMKRAVWRAPAPRADSSSSEGSFQTLLTARTIGSMSEIQALSRAMRTTMRQSSKEHKIYVFLKSGFLDGPLCFV